MSKVRVRVLQINFRLFQRISCRLFEELKTQHNQEKATLSDEINNLKVKLAETEEQNQKHQAEIIGLRKSVE